MLSPRLSTCKECSNIDTLLSDIDCKIFDMSKVLYNNTTLMLGKPFTGEIMSKLLHYKRILTYKRCNPNYAGNFTVNDIASKVKLLIYKS